MANNSQTFQVNDFVDGQRIGGFHIALLVWSFLTMFADGFDLNSIGFAAPDLARLYGVARSEMAPVLSANLYGIFLGAPILGWLGDRYGRRPIIIGGTLLYGVVTLIMAWTSTMEQMVVLRFIAGIGIGGIMPNTIALNSELTPKSFRSTLIVLMFMGITTGSTGVGVVASSFMAEHGWQIIFQVGGVLPVIIGICLVFTLPESLKFLATRPDKQRELIATARRMRPDLAIAEDARFENPPIIAATTSGSTIDSASAPNWLRPMLHIAPIRWVYGELADLFKGSLALITPLLWLCFCIALMANYFLNNTLPLIYEQYGISQEDANLTLTMYHAGGIFGGFVISLLLDRMGFRIVTILFAIALPAVALLGLEGMHFLGMASFAAIAGITILGAQFGNNATAGLIYPTSIRSKGVGIALSIGRLGSIAGPIVGAHLLGMKDLTMQNLFLLACTPILLGLIAAVILSRLCYKRFNSYQLDDTPAD
jgi:AAHS family 4-hydroxybenzoate transporter-like MFS transporter